jgi:cardiolipin synthase
VADKLLIVTSFVMLGLIGGVPIWLAVVVVSRDVLILLGFAVVFLLVEERMKVKPTVMGKCSTMLQLLTLGVALALLHDPAMLDFWIRDLLIGATAVATVLSGLQYLYKGLMWLQNKAPSITRLS